MGRLVAQFAMADESKGRIILWVASSAAVGIIVDPWGLTKGLRESSLPTDWSIYKPQEAHP